MTTQNIKPIEQNQRIVIIDILRGWALIGVVLVNYFLFFYFGKEITIPTDDHLSHIVRLLTDIVFTNKSRIMLNVLFGFGFATLINNISNKGINPILFFSKRMFWLFVIGLINTCFYNGDFLKDYAIVGLLMLVFYKASENTALYFAIALMFIYPFTTVFFYSHFPSHSPATDIRLYESNNIFDVLLYGLKEGTRELYETGRLLGINLFVLACFLFGQYLQKIAFFHKIIAGKISAKKMFWLSLGATIIIAVISDTLTHLFKIAFFKQYNIQFWLEFGLMIVFISAFCWIYKKGKLKTFFSALQSVGKMTLTNYIVQNIIGILLFSGFGLGLLHHLPFYAYILIAISIYILQVYFSKWWMTKYNYGPVEWIWRQLTYMKRLPIKRQLPGADRSPAGNIGFGKSRV
ncbi:MAG: DUF418 domain-containing protein [Ferruginibacter sp.]